MHGPINIRLKIQPLKAQDLLNVPSVLTFRNSVFCQQCIYVFCVDLRTNSDYYSIQYKLIRFCNRGRECLLRGTDWIFNSDTVSSFTHFCSNLLMFLYICCNVDSIRLIRKGFPSLFCYSLNIFHRHLFRGVSFVYCHGFEK